MAAIQYFGNFACKNLNEIQIFNYYTILVIEFLNQLSKCKPIRIILYHCQSLVFINWALADAMLCLFEFCSKSFYKKSCTEEYIVCPHTTCAECSSNSIHCHFIQFNFHQVAGHNKLQLACCVRCALQIMWNAVHSNTQTSLSRCDNMIHRGKCRRALNREKRVLCTNTQWCAHT